MTKYLEYTLPNKIDEKKPTIDIYGFQNSPRWYYHRNILSIYIKGTLAENYNIILATDNKELSILTFRKY